MTLDAWHASILLVYGSAAGAVSVGMSPAGEYIIAAIRGSLDEHQHHLPDRGFVSLREAMEHAEELGRRFLGACEWRSLSVLQRFDQGPGPDGRVIQALATDGGAWSLGVLAFTSDRGRLSTHRHEFLGEFRDWRAAIAAGDGWALAPVAGPPCPCTGIDPSPSFPGGAAVEVPPTRSRRPGLRRHPLECSDVR